LPFARVTGPALALAAALLVPTSLATASSAATAPVAASAQNLVAAGKSADTIRKRVESLDAAAKEAVAQYAAAKAKVVQLEAQLREAQLEVSAATARLESARKAAGQLASASYRKGALDPTLLQVLLANNPDAVLTHASFVGRINHRQAVVVTRVRDAQADLQQKQAKLGRELTTLESARVTAEDRSKKVSADLAEARSLLAALEAKERQRLATAARSSSSQRASRAGGRTAIVAVAGSCSPSGSRGAERGLTPNALRIMRCGLSAFPQIDYAGGLGTRGNATDHDDGRAIDFMIPNYRSGVGNDLGWALAEWASKQPGVKYVIFDQRIHGSWSGGWRLMENRGGDTANHRDHVHVSVN
jgi:peptidoglycan hydrolase CwlO-like protein